MSSTTWNGSSSTDWATGANWSTGSVPTTGAHVVIPDTSSINNCALDTTRTIGSLTIEANGTLVGGGNKLIIQSEGDASGGTEGFAVNNDGIISGNLDLEVNTQATTTCDFNGTSGNFKNVKINDVNVDATFHTDTTFDGTLIVAGGTLKPQGGSTIDVHGDVTISSGATFGVSTGTGTHRFGSLTVNGTHVATSGETIIDNERSNGRAVDIVGTFTHNTGTLSIQTAADTDLRWPSSSQAYNLRINNASCIARPTGDNKPVIANNLSIDAGTFNTLDAGGSTHHGLTVLGDTTGAGTLALNNSTYTGGGTGDSLSMTGTVTIGTSGVITNVDQLGETGGTITCTGSPTLGCQRWRQQPANWTPATSTLKIESNDRQFQTNGYGTPYNLEIDNSGNTNELSDFVVVSNNLTITAGTLDTSSSNRALTVTGEVNIASGATLTCNSSVCSFGSLHSQGTANLADASGSTLITNEDGDGLSIIAGTFSNCVPSTIKHNNGTVTFNNHSDPAAHAAIVIGVSTSTDGLYNVIIDGANTIVDTYQPSGGSQHCTIFNDFTVTNGNFRVNSASNLFTVLGNVALNGGNMFNTSAAPTAAHSFGSLTIGSGTTFKATSGTTTITGGNSSTGYSFNNSGTFTHNKGKIKVAFTPSQNWYSQCNEYYDLELAYTENWNLYLTDQSGGAITILGDLTITHGMLEVYTSADSLTVHGLTTNKGTFENAANQDTNKITHHGLVTNTGNYRINDGTTVKMNGGIRNLGTITVA